MFLSFQANIELNFEFLTTSKILSDEEKDAYNDNENQCCT